VIKGDVGSIECDDSSQDQIFMRIGKDSTGRSIFRSKNA
jgi:hypothetical protein